MTAYAFFSLGHATKIVVGYENDSIELASTESLDSSLQQILYQ